jgi:hypothetical protein
MSSSPVISREVECPVCKKSTLQYYISKKQYHVNKYDDDFRPVEYQWFNSEYEHYNPHYYEIFYCPFCFYADEKESYMNGRNTHSVQTGSQKRIEQIIMVKRKQQDQAYVLLGSAINTEKMNFNTVLNLHLLAIYIHELPESDIRDYEKLASLYHKTAWLFRESREVTFNITKDKTYEQLSNVFYDYYSKFKFYISRFNYYRYHIKQEINSADLEDNFRKKYFSELYKIEQLISDSNELHANIINLHEFGLGDFQIDTEETRKNQIFKFDQTFSNFIKEISLFWQYIPISENLCLENTATCLVLALDNARRNLTFFDKQKIYRKLIPISIKLGKFGDSIRYTQNYLQYISDFIKIAQNRLKRLEKYNSVDEIDKIISQLHSARVDEKKFTEKIKSIKREKNKKDLRTANSICKMHPKASIKELKKRFSEAGISEASAVKLISHLENNREMILMNKHT